MGSALLQFFVLVFILMLVELAMACVFLVYSTEVGALSYTFN